MATSTQERVSSKQTTAPRPRPSLGTTVTKPIAQVDIRSRKKDDEVSAALPPAPPVHRVVMPQTGPRPTYLALPPEYRSYQELIARAVDVFGDPIKASRWLSIPNQDLNGQTPLQVSQSDGYSTRLIEPIFLRIEHGIDY